MHRPPDDEARPVERIVALAGRYGRYGYRRFAALLRAEGSRVDQERAERPWRREDLKVPRGQPG
jgi:putative transposase